MPVPAKQPRVLRVVGPPGSGKSLLITSLVEALRGRGYRLATLVPRDERVTVIVLSHGGRVTLERPMTLNALLDVVTGIDPTVDLVLAEGYADAGIPAVELRPAGAEPLPLGVDRFAVVESEAFAATFARSGPGETGDLAARIEREVLGVARDDVVPGAPPGRFGRLVRKITGR